MGKLAQSEKWLLRGAIKQTNSFKQHNLCTELKEDGNLFFKTDTLPRITHYKTELISLPNYNSSDKISHGNIIA